MHHLQCIPVHRMLGYAWPAPCGPQPAPVQLGMCAWVCAVVATKGVMKPPALPYSFKNTHFVLLNYFTFKACSHFDAHAIRHRLMRIKCASIAFTLYF